jgi:DNA-binding response OmpR family regulator
MDSKPILVVDDERNIRETLTQALEPLGMAVECAINGEEALRHAKETDFALVLLDLKLPGKDGLEVLRGLRDLRPHTPVVMVTAHATVGIAVDAMKLGAVDLVQKPFGMDEIRATVKRVIARTELEEDDADDYPSLIELAYKHITERRFDEAQTFVRKAISTDPGQPEAYNLLGALLEIRGDWLEAQKFYRAALDISPGFKPAQANLERTTSFDKRGDIHLLPPRKGDKHP